MMNRIFTVGIGVAVVAAGLTGCSKDDAAPAAKGTAVVKVEGKEIPADGPVTCDPSKDNPGQLALNAGGAGTFNVSEGDAPSVKSVVMQIDGEGYVYADGASSDTRITVTKNGKEYHFTGNIDQLKIDIEMRDHRKNIDAVVTCP